MREYFKEENIQNPPLDIDSKCCTSLTLEVGEFKKLTSKLEESCVVYYISEERLKERMAKSGKSKTEIIRMLIPDKGSVMAGEFGEILATELIYEDIKERHKTGNYNPHKLRWKEDRNKAAQKTDVVLINKANEKLNIYSAEVKVKSTGCPENQINEMFAGIIDDRGKRLGLSLYWIKEKENLNGEKREIDYIDSVVEKFKKFDVDNNIEKKFMGVLVADQSIDSIKKFSMVKPKIKVNGNSIKPVKHQLIKLGAIIEENNIINFENVKIADINALPENNAKNRKVKDKIDKWFKNAMMVLGDREEVTFKIIEIDNLKDCYEKVFSNLISNEV